MHIPTVEREAYDSFLEAIPDPIKEKVEAKIQEDEDQFMRAVTAFTPSLAPSYWAKRSCKHCHGQGVVGKNILTGAQISCRCAEKRFFLWLREFRKWYNALKAQGVTNA